ncbi:MAG: transposase [Deltaproteobacteria bacterium]|nr:transposase [Deltaproteobacteria bacterium]
MTVGIDLGDRRSTACVDGAGVVVRWFEFPMTPEGVREAFTNQGFGRVAMEAGAQSGWVMRELRKLGYEPLVANPRKLKAISANERKSDRNDALLLARLAVADASLLYPIRHRTEARGTPASPEPRSEQRALVLVGGQGEVEPG